MKPNKELTDMLLAYYGELMYQKQECKEYFEIRSVEKKLNAINILLDMPIMHFEAAIKEVLKQMEENGGL